MASTIRYADERSRRVAEDALRVSEPHIVEDFHFEPTVHRKVVRQVEVPYAREVKVPVRTSRVETVMTKQKMPVRKLVEVPTWAWVEEKYTEIEEVPATRKKEVWVRQVIDEPYMAKVEVERSRRVKKPTTVIQEVDDVVEVDVPTSRVVQVDGFRIDTVEDTKLVEVEEVQEFELQPVAKGTIEMRATRDLGRTGRPEHIARDVGDRYYAPVDPRLDAWEEDSQPGNERRVRTREVAMTRPSSAVSGGARGADALRRPSSAASARSSIGGQGGIGLQVKTGPRGCDVVGIKSGSSAAACGVAVGDVVTHVDGVATRDLNDFRSAMLRAGPSVMLTLRKDGSRDIVQVRAVRE